MKKLLTLSFLLLIISYSLSAQKARDILTLKSGAKVFGNLLEISDNQYRIMVNDSTLLVFPAQDIEKYSKEQNVNKSRRDSGLGFSIEGGFMIAAQSSTYNKAFSFNAALHYAVNTTNIFGIGSGVEYFGKPYTPIFLEYRYLLHARRVTPYFFARAGGMAYFGSNDYTTYTYNPKYFLRKDYGGGSTFTLGTGISWYGDGIETNLSFAYRYARTSYRQTEYNVSAYTYTTNYNRLEIKLGFRF
jgi:hypothetical protein